MKLRSYAKVNLVLRILGRRPDGFHDLESLFAAISVGDEIELKEAASGIGLRCDDPAIPTGPKNLVWRAAELLAERAGIAKGVRIRLRKEVPPGSGLGGGSSNAAAALVGLNALWGAGLSRDTLRELAAVIGSDVPFFLEGGLCVATGRGEILAPLNRNPALWMTLVRPADSVSTPWAYGALDALPVPPMGGGLSEMVNALDEGPEAIARRLGNDLEAAVLPSHPKIVAARGDLLAHGALGALMSGSGSAVFGIARDQGHAEAMAGSLSSLYPWVRTARTVGSAVEFG